MPMVCFSPHLTICYQFHFIISGVECKGTICYWTSAWVRSPSKELARWLDCHSCSRLKSLNTSCKSIATNQKLMIHAVLRFCYGGSSIMHTNVREASFQPLANIFASILVTSVQLYSVWATGFHCKVLGLNQLKILHARNCLSSSYNLR